jgi:hypothetical protein
MKNYIEIMEKVFLVEMPRFTGDALLSGDSAISANYAELIEVKEENNANGAETQQFPNGLVMMYLNASEVLVWIEENGVVQIIAALKLLNNMPDINTMGKLPKSHVYASDFFTKIIEVFGKLLFSGHALSTEAVKLWKNMVKRGLNIFAYDPNNSTRYEKITHPDELDKYLGSTEEYENTRFVLTKNSKMTESIIQIFEMYRMHKLVNHNF